MSKHAIVLYYSGFEPDKALIEKIARAISSKCRTSIEDIVVQHYDEESIARAVGENAIRKIVFDADESDQTNKKKNTVKVVFNVGTAKLQVVKFIKDLFNLTLKEAKEIADAGIIMVPESTDAYSFVQGLCSNGGSIAAGCDDVYVIAQAAIFLNNKYPNNLQVEQFVKDYAMASYHDRVHATDEFEDALLGAANAVKSNPSLANKWISENLVKTITLL